MSEQEIPPDALEVQAISDLYQQAAHELLQAYQRNKEAMRHHAGGAFRAALHHARMSSVHATAAHEHLAHALQRSAALSPVPLLVRNTAACTPQRWDQ